MENDKTLNQRELDTFMIFATMINMALLGFGVGENIQLGNILSASTVFYLSAYIISFYVVYNRAMFYIRSRIELAKD